MASPTLAKELRPATIYPGITREEAIRYVKSCGFEIEGFYTPAQDQKYLTMIYEKPESVVLRGDSYDLSIYTAHRYLPAGPRICLKPQVDEEVF